MAKKYLCIIGAVCAIIFLLAGDHTLAVNYDEKIKEAEQEQKSFEKKAARLQKEIEEIEKSKEDAMLYIEKMDKKMSELEESLDQLGKEIKTAKTELGKAEQELERVQAEEQKQYIAMKKRIKYMYENGNGEYWEILFGASGITDLLNRSEYIEKISSYDNRIFINYQEIRGKVQEQEKEIERRVNELTEMRAETRAEKQSVKELRENKKQELKKYRKKLTDSQEKVDEYYKQAIAAENEVEELLRKKQDEIDRQQNIGSGTSDGDGSGKSAGLIWPLSGGAGRLSSGFGPRTSPTAGASSYHRGIDLAIASGTPILAAGSGEVVTATYSSSAGNYVMISHGNRLYTVYMHCSRLAVKVGDSVNKGQVIAYVGSTGISTGAHLHFGVSKNGTYVNPLNYVFR